MAGPGILSSLLPITLLAPFTAFPLGPPIPIIPAAPRLQNTPTQPENLHLGTEQGGQAKNNRKEPTKLPRRLPSCPTTANSLFVSLQESGSDQL